MQGVAGWFKWEAPEISASAPRIGILARFPGVIQGSLSAGVRRKGKLTSGVAAVSERERERLRVERRR